MCTARRLALSFLIAAAAALTAAPTPASAAMALRYQATLIGLPLANVSAVLDPRSTFRITSDLETAGIVDLFSPWRHHASAAGRLSADGAGIAGVRYRGDSVRRSEETYAQLLFEPTLTTVEAVKLAPKALSENRQVPPPLRNGTVDPLTAFYILAERLDRGRGCDGPIAVFDGRYRYDLLMSAGPDALSCHIAYRQVAGFSKSKEPYVDASKATPGLIRYVRLADGFPPVPQRLEVPTRFGSVVVALADWSIEAPTVTTSQ